MPKVLDTAIKTANQAAIDALLKDHQSYFDGLLKAIDPQINLDYNQRQAIVADDDYCLIVAGAGAGKTTTIAAKVKYLVEKKQIAPQDIIVISYTRKAIAELQERINNKLGIPARICTFHSFAYDIGQKTSAEPPELNHSADNIIFEALEKQLFSDPKLLRQVLMFMSYYFDLPAEALDYADLNQFHLAKSATEYETLKSSLGEYIIKVASQRESTMHTLSGEYLRSEQEVQIANFLYLNGLDYEYRPTYPQTQPSKGKKYTPDFLIRQKDNIAYLEHYALSESGGSKILTMREVTCYWGGIKFRRQLHQQKSTKLLETWAAYNDGRPLIEHLQELLIQAGFKLKEQDFALVYQKIVASSKSKYVAKLMQFLLKFIAQFKTCGYDAEGFAELRSKTDNPRTQLFLDIAEPVYLHYQQQLAARNQIDFADMINNAHAYLAAAEQQQLNLPYKYIIIDEFQDIARQRFNLTKKLSDLTRAKVVAVGDDWQSIFAFSGAYIDLFTRFLELMGGGTEIKILHTYRNSQELINIAGGFVQKILHK